MTTRHDTTKQRGGAKGTLGGITGALTRMRWTSCHWQTAIHTWGVSTMSHTWIATADLQWKSNLAIQLSFIFCCLSRYSRPGSSADIGAPPIRRQTTTDIHSRFHDSDGRSDAERT